MKIRRYLYIIKAYIPYTREFRVSRGVTVSLKKYQKTLKLLNEYDKGNRSLKDTVAGPKNLRSYLRKI